MNTDFIRCSAFKPDGERCKRVAGPGGIYCHAHRNMDVPEPGEIEPIPAGSVHRIDSNAWGKCEFCGDVFPLANLRPDGNNKLACSLCYLWGALLDAASLWTAPDGTPHKLLSPAQVHSTAAAFNISPEAAVPELLSRGWRLERIGKEGGQFYIKPQPPEPKQKMKSLFNF